MIRYRGLVHKEYEEIVYNDEFSVSILDLVLKYKPKTTKDVQSLLDGNGYYGRAKAFDVYSGGFRTDTCRVKVNMIWSRYSYTWPFKGRWSFKTNSIERISRINAIDISMGIALDNLFRWYGTTIHCRDYSDRISKKRERDILEFLQDTKVIGPDGFMIDTKIDLQEFKENVIGIKD